MGDKKDILEDGGMHRLPYRVPEGYFSGLESRLSEIPDRSQVQLPSARGFFQKVAPYLAMAACFTLALVVGKFLAGRTQLEAEPAASEEYSRYYEAGLLPVTRTYISPEDEEEMSVQEADEDDIREYLISSRTSTGLIAYVLDK